MPQYSTNFDSLAGTYRLLAAFWGEELTAGQLELLDAPQAGELWQSLGGIDPRTGSQSLDDLAETYCRLFIGPVGHASPIQSVWTSGELQSTVVKGVTEFASICQYTSLWQGMLPDHLANELQMMAVILEAIPLDSSATDIRDAIDLAAGFRNQHLKWSQPFFEQIMDRDPDGFYGSLAKLTAAFLADDSLHNFDIKPQHQL